MAAGALDPVTLAVIQSGLVQVCNEMDLAFCRAAFSPVISEAMDRSDGIYGRDGALIAQGDLGLPVFVGTMQFSTQAVIERVPEVAAGRRDHRQRSLSRRHAPDGRAFHQAVLLPRRALRLAGQHRPLAGYRRRRAGRLLGECHRGRAGGPAPAAGQALQGGPARSGDPGDHPLQHPDRRPANRRHQGAGRGAHRRREAPDRPARPLWPAAGRGRDRRASRPRRAADARQDRRDPGWRLAGRGVRRFATASTTARCASP